MAAFNLPTGPATAPGFPHHRNATLPEVEDLEAFVDRALDVPGGSELGATLRRERHLDETLRRFRLAERTKPTPPAPMLRPPRVVVEMQGAKLADAVQRILCAEGYQVAVCGGPATFPDGQCPLVEGRGCPLVEQADVVVHALGVEDPDAKAVLEALGQAHAATPTIVVVGTGGSTQAGAADGQVVIEGALTREKLLAAIERGLQETRAAI